MLLIKCFVLTKCKVGRGVVAGEGGALLRPVELHRGRHAVTHSATGGLVQLRRLGDGLQIPASSLLPRGVAWAVRRDVSVGVAPVHLVEPTEIPRADAMEARVAGF